MKIEKSNDMVFKNHGRYDKVIISHVTPYFGQNFVPKVQNFTCMVLGRANK